MRLASAVAGEILVGRTVDANSGQKRRNIMGECHERTLRRIIVLPPRQPYETGCL